MKKLLLSFLGVLLLAMASSVQAAPINEFEDFEDEILGEAFVDGSMNTSVHTLADGTKAFKIIADKQMSHLYVSSADMAADDKYIISYDVMLHKLPTTGVSDTDNKELFALGSSPYNGTVGMSIVRKPDGTVAFMVGKNEKMPMEKDKWYKIVITKNGNTNDNGYIYVVNEEGTIINNRYWMEPASNPYRIALLVNPYGSVTDTEILVDNLVFGGTKDSDSPRLAYSSVADGKTDVLRNQKICFTFNQELDSLSAVSVSDSQGNIVPATAKVGVNTVEINFPTLLERNETYTVSFADVKNKNQVSCSSEGLSFTTEDFHLMSAPMIGDVAANGDKTKINFTLKDPHGYSRFSGILMAAAYNDENLLMGFDMLDLSDIEIDVETEKEFDFSIAGAAKVKIAAFDYSGGLSPLAVNEKTLE